MDIAAVKKRLHQKVEELEAEIARHEASLRRGTRSGVGDVFDRIVSAEGSDEQLRHADSASRTTR
jgi:hypothetical protein